jgi:DNA processing protein
MRELEGVEGIGSKIAGTIFRARNDAEVDAEIAKAADAGVRIICPQDEEYPKALRHIPDPPPCLYIRGAVQAADAVAVGIVGTRRCSHYGHEQAVRFAEALAGAGFTIVSGLARGVDADAHRGALRAGGRTLAVLGNGLGTIYPPEHGELADEIETRGAVLSELPIDEGPDPSNFPGRNRVIAGLSLGIIVIEAGAKSGALITARLATEYNREVFALPGGVDRPHQNAGSNALIREGEAKLVTCLEDVLDELGRVGDVMRFSPEAGTAEYPDAAPAAVAKLATHEKAVLDAVVSGVEDGDDIGSQCGLPAARVNATLTILQLRGLIRQLPGNRFVKR